MYNYKQNYDELCGDGEDLIMLSINHLPISNNKCIHKYLQR